MDLKKIIARIYDHLENDATEKAVMACIRLARGAEDHLNTAIFLREIHHNNKDVIRALHDDMPQHKQDAIKFLVEVSLNRWMETHTVDFWGDKNLPASQQRNLLGVTVGEIDQEIDQWEKVISGMTLPQGMSPFDIAAFTDDREREKSEIRLRMKALHQIKTRIKAKCLNYAIQMERQIVAQEKGIHFLDEVQNTVNNYFKSHNYDIFKKLMKASELALSRETEDAALLLTEVRRVLKAVADHFYPAKSGLVMCIDGTERSMTEEQYLNRLQQYLSQRTTGGSARELLRSELDALAAFIRRINDMASKGVHANVTLAESRQGVVGLYFFLFNLCQNLTLPDPADLE
ncbi:hypothetical protein [Bosea sp. (in: a-proteobacteria)]|uniref:hypothetical protein n=1 Tax=Bosea sp. (in: a-proteobacteria) TaxID=1871050 RepID=UPI004034ED26